MKVTFGILAHADAGKTTFSEQILYKENVIRTPGRVDSKDTCLDHDDIERSRGITIFSDTAIFTHAENTYYLIDTPGHTDFSAEMERAMEVMDYAVLVINGTDGVQGHTEIIWELLERFKIPVFIFINKLDIVSASYVQTFEDIKKHLSQNALDFRNIYLESGREAAFTDDLIDNLSQLDESLLEQWLDGTVTFENLKAALTEQIKRRQLFPCFGGCALTGEGIDRFLQTFYCLTKTSYPEIPPFSGRVFKIRYDDRQERMTYIKILSGTLQVRDSLSEAEKVHQIRVFQGERFRTVNEAFAGDVVAVTGLKDSRAGQGLGSCRDLAVPSLHPTLQAKVIYSSGIPHRTMLHIFHILEEEDPSLGVVWQETLQQLKINIMGKIQLEVLEQSILRRFGIPVFFAHPEVVYMETISEPVTGYGHFEPLRHYAEVSLRIEPVPEGAGFPLKVNVMWTGWLLISKI